MMCMHGERAALTATEHGNFWYCNQPSSCGFVCSEDHAYIFAPVVNRFFAAKEERSTRCGVTPEASDKRNYDKTRVDRDMEKSKFGEPFLTRSKESDCYAGGDEKPSCKRGKPCRLPKVKKEGSNQYGNFLYCPRCTYSERKEETFK